MMLVSLARKEIWFQALALPTRRQCQLPANSHRKRQQDWLGVWLPCCRQGQTVMHAVHHLGQLEQAWLVGKLQKPKLFIRPFLVPARCNAVSIQAPATPQQKLPTHCLVLLSWTGPLQPTLLLAQTQSLVLVASLRLVQPYPHLDPNHCLLPHRVLPNQFQLTTLRVSKALDKPMMSMRWLMLVIHKNLMSRRYGRSVCCR